ncbi:hypothetical protein B0H11DRAFT_1918951 [Mycena galericulata]|nr:hypothetical protein B0H11DRAFT_1918951 [Mycena galericulata]
MYGFKRRVYVSLGITASTTVALGITRGRSGDNPTRLFCNYAQTSPCLPLEGRVIRESPQFYKATQTKFGLHIQVPPRHGKPFTYHRSVGLRSNSLLPIMVRDVYRVICAVILANIIMYYIITAGSLAWVATTISVTMISRLMLNLHDAASGVFSLTFTAQCDQPEHELDAIQFRTRRWSEGYETHV